MADVTFRNSTTQDLGGASAGTVTVVKPTGTLSTDVVLLVFGIGQPTAQTSITYSAPAGWNALAGSPSVFDSGGNGKFGVYVWWAFGNVNFANVFTQTAGSNSFALGVVCMSFSGCDQTNPVNVTGTFQNNTNSATISVNAITTTIDRCLEVIMGTGGGAGGTTWSATGFTDIANAGAQQVTNGLYANAVTTPKGSTGAVTVTTTAGSSGQVFLVVAVALSPPVGGGSSIVESSFAVGGLVESVGGQILMISP
jgi:hypothetical protein